MAPTLTGTNCLTKSEDQLIELLANTPAVQLFLGVGDSISAKDRIHSHDLPQPADKDSWTKAEFTGMFPCCVISPPSDGVMFQLNGNARDAGLSYDINTRFAVRFEMLVTPGDDDQQAVRRFLNLAFDGVEGMAERINAGEDGEYHATSFSVAGSMYRGKYDTYEALGDTLGVKVDMERTVEQ